tara:strand:- start:1116 stop:1556 length:441 start_codon:yes stop_codon:yes gene_type:complete
MADAFNTAWSIVKQDERSFRVQMGPKGMYLVIEYEDGKELFMDDYQKFMMELQQAEATGDERLVEMQFGVGSDYHNIAEEPENVGKSEEKGDNAPTNPALWSQAKSKARAKFDVYPSAYANAWASKWYKGKGGGWKKKSKGKKGKK